MFWRKKASPSHDSEYNQEQLQTMLDGDIAREAVHVAKVLSNPDLYNLPTADALRSAVNGRNAEYLFSRFATDFGWASLGDAKAFYSKHKGGRGGWY